MQRPSFRPGERDSPGPGKGFLDLPGEIRNQIYLLIIPYDKRIRPVIRCQSKSTLRPQQHDQHYAVPNHDLFPFAQICKQVTHEMLPLVYELNTLSFESVYDLYVYLCTIGPALRSSIRSIRVFLVYRDILNRNQPIKPQRAIPMQKILKMTFDLLGDCTALQKLYLGVQLDTLNSVGNKLCSLRDLRKTGVFDGVRGMPNLDLRVREIWFWEQDWGLKTAPFRLRKLPGDDEFPLDQFAIGIWAQPNGESNKRFPMQKELDYSGLVHLEMNLKADMAHPKVDEKNAAPSSSKNKDGCLVEERLSLLKPFQRAGGIVRTTASRSVIRNGPAIASSSRKPIWRP